jgi:Subtilase family
LNRTFLRTLALAAGFALAACQGGSYGSSAIPQGPAVPAQQSLPEQPSEMPSAENAQAPAEQAGPDLPVPGDGEIPITAADAVHQVCPRPLPGQRQCFALERQDLRANDLNPNATHQGYGPSDLQAAYNIAGGRPTLVAIVDAYGYPKASSDLASYRSYYHLPTCTTGNGCLKIRNQTGGTKLPRSNPNWDAEQAVDLDMVSAMCPGCKLLLVEANSDYTSDLYQAESEAAKLGAVVISNSFGASEYSQCQGGGEKSDPAFSSPGHIYVAAAGDLGGGLRDCGGPQQPCSLSTVVCVGGTHLVRANNARGWKESVWNELSSPACGGSSGCGATGSGCSTIVKKPSWQNDGGCRMRSEADVAAEASVLTPVAVFFSGYGGWTAFGGTSVSTPLIAGVFGRAGNGRNGNGPQNLWAHRGHLYVQTVGSNLYKPISGNCASNVRYICYAAKNYNGPTGLGTPNGLAAF